LCDHYHRECIEAYLFRKGVCEHEYFTDPDEFMFNKKRLPTKKAIRKRFNVKN
jgi:hypothetical protein